jgi:SAM-dependent methyltransferase
MNIPWWLKIPAKVVLSRTPVPPGLWKRLHLFEHGHMENPKYALDVFMSHFEAASFSKKEEPFCCLELGSGDSLASGLVASAHGASKTYLIDVDRFATEDLATYQSICRCLAQHGKPLPEFSGNTLEEICEQFHIEYLTNGLESLKQIDSDSVDFIWSHAVLEHVRRHEFRDVQRELKRILSPGGIASHQVDLRDHLAGSLNHLRFSEKIWESSMMANSGFYTNRISHGEMLEHFTAADFTILDEKESRWGTLPLPIGRFAKQFQKLPEQDLTVWEFRILLQ